VGDVEPVTGTEIALIISASGTFLSAVVASIGAIISLSNSRKLDAVHQSTNGLSERAEALAKKLGIEEGKAAEKANPS
jgi:hypothetical protein